MSLGFGFCVPLWGAYHIDPNFGSAAAVALPKFFHTEVFGLGPMSAVSGAHHKSHHQVRAN